MTTQSKETESLKWSQERLAEIGQILYAAIKRFNLREVSKHNINQLDSKVKASIHDVSNNLNHKAYE